MATTVPTDAALGTGELHVVLAEALRDREVARRLRQADVAARVRIGGDAVALLLDRDPPAVAQAGPDPAVELAVTHEDWERFLAGRLPLAVAVAGDHRGPVRRLLRVMPIVRRLVVEARTRSAR